MPVGNDIVDLRDPGSRPGGIHPRFDLRVFTSEERERILSDALPARLRWALWSAKESAFKAARQIDPGLRFIPRRFTVPTLDDALAEVLHPVAGRFRVWFECSVEWIHAVAVPFTEGIERPATRVARREPEPEERWSASALGDCVRELARAAVAPFLRCSAGDLRIVMVRGIPKLLKGECRLPVDLSLSHHGRFVACSWQSAARAVLAEGRAEGAITGDPAPQGGSP